MIALQIGRFVLAALAVFWILSLVGWLPEALASGDKVIIVRSVAGILIALLPAWGYTKLTAMVEARKQQASRNDEA